MACVPDTQEETSAQAPALGKADGAADGSDSADHECHIVLRTVSRQPSGDTYETDCSKGECLWVWRGDIDAAESAQGSVHVLYHRQSDPSWWEVPTEPASGAMLGFRRFTFRMSDHLFGPSGPEETIELVPFLRSPDGGRLFDHNNNYADTVNHQLLPNWYFSVGDFGVCEPTVGALWFGDNWEESSGLLHAGAYLQVNYDIDRLPECRGTHNGYPAWDTVAFLKFFPGMQEFSGSVRVFDTVQGQPSNVAHDLPFVVTIPDDATQVEAWFSNYTGAGSTCQAWDSNYGANYRFEIAPSLEDPRCDGVENWSSIYGGQATCTSYALSEQVDATNCELFINGFGHGYEGHYGIPFEWLEAFVSVTDEEVLTVGLLTSYSDPARGGATDVRYSLGQQIADGVWKTGFTYHSTAVQGGQTYQYVVNEFAIFMDVRRPSGEVVRLWQSRGGANYDWADAFGLSTTPQGIPYGTMQWANEASGVYDVKTACL